MSPDTVNFSEVLLVVVFCSLLLALHPVKHVLKAMAHKHKAKAFCLKQKQFTYPPYTIFVYVITRAYGNIISISTLYFWHFWYVFDFLVISPKKEKSAKLKFSLILTYIKIFSKKEAVPTILIVKATASF